MLISVNAEDKPDAAEIAELFHEDGFKIYATGETCKRITEAGIPAEHVNKDYEGRPNVRDLIINGKLDLIVNSPFGKYTVHDDSYLRKDAIKAHIPYITTIAAARAAAEGIRELKRSGTSPVMSLQELHGKIG